MTTQIHPKAAEAEAAAAKRRKEREEQAKLVADLKQRGVRFLHIGSITVAYRISRRDIVHVANTIRHPNDKHDALLAKSIAGLRLMHGNYVTLRKPPNTPFCTMTVKNLIQATFHLTACR